MSFPIVAARGAGSFNRGVVTNEQTMRSCRDNLCVGHMRLRRRTLNMDIDLRRLHVSSVAHWLLHVDVGVHVHIHIHACLTDHEHITHSAQLPLACDGAPAIVGAFIFNCVSIVVLLVEFNIHILLYFAFDVEVTHIVSALSLDLLLLQVQVELTEVHGVLGSVVHIVARPARLHVHIHVLVRHANLYIGLGHLHHWLLNNHAWLAHHYAWLLHHDWLLHHYWLLDHHSRLLLLHLHVHLHYC